MRFIILLIFYFFLMCTISKTTSSEEIPEGTNRKIKLQWHNTTKELLDLSFAEAVKTNVPEKEILQHQRQILFTDSFLTPLAQSLEASHASQQSLQGFLKSRSVVEQSAVLPIFVLGAPRSGTTLLGNYIGSCAKVCNLIEYPGPYLALRIGPSFQKKVKADYKPELYNTLFECVTLFSANLVRQKGCKSYVDSSPFNLRVIKQLQDKIGPALFIVMLRDYRGVISSLKKSYEAGYSWAGKDDRERAELYYKFYKRLKDINPHHTIFLNYDQLCQDPNKTLDEFNSKFYDKLTTLFEVPNPEHSWKLDRRVLGQSHAPTYSIVGKGSNFREARTFSINEKEGILSQIASYNPEEWPPQREMEVYEWVTKVAQKLTSNNLLGEYHDVPAFAAFYNSLENLRKRYEGKIKPLMISYQNCNPVIWTVPLLNKNFIGREAFLQDLHSRLQEQPKDMMYSVITGMPGVGKTQLVKNYANLYKGNYHIIWWFNGTNDLDKQYEELARSINDNLAFWNQGLDKSLKLEKITTNFTTRVKDWLRTTPYNWLLIFDDVPNEASIHTYLLENQSSSCGHIIVTSKNSNGWPSVVHLRTFERFESIQLLEKLTGIGIDQSNAGVLAELLGDFPLALAQAGAYIKEHSLPSFQEYITLYITKRKELERYEEELRHQDKPIAYDSYNATIAVTFNLALEEIQKNSPEAFELLTLCAFIHKRNILEEILKDWLIYRDIKSNFAFRNATRQLMQYSLIEKENDNVVHAIGNTYALHELVQRVIQDKIFLAHSSFLDSLYKFLISMADSPVKFGGGKVKTAEQEVIEDLCNFFVLKAKSLLTMDFNALDAYKKCLSYSSYIAELIEHARRVDVTPFCFFEAKWVGKLLFYVGASTSLISDNTKLAYEYVFTQAINLFSDHKHKSRIMLEDDDSLKVLTGLLDPIEIKDPKLQNIIGTLYTSNLWINIDYQIATSWFKKAAEQGEVGAQSILGTMYITGQGVPQNYMKAQEWFERAARQGNAEAQFYLGVIYEHGQGVPQDYRKAHEWLEKAAEQGNVEAQYEISVMLYYGRGVPQNYAKAQKWLEISAEQGYKKAQYNLGIMYYHGQGNNQDYAQAHEWFKKAAEQGYAEAQYALGTMYVTGQGVPRDYRKAHEWLEKAAERGNVKAQLNLSIMYYYGEGIPQNYTKAREWLEKAAERGNVEAQYKLGIMRYCGQGVKQDYAQAQKWLERAAKQGDGRAQLNLGVMYYNGQGRDQNYTKALKWYLKAAHQENVEAKCNIALMYYQGRGIKQDLGEAWKWFREVTEQENTTAQRYLGIMYQKLNQLHFEK